MADFQDFSYTKEWTNPLDFPVSQANETQARQDMQSLFDEVKNYINVDLKACVTAVADRMDYGVVMLSDSTSSGSDAYDGVAATPKAVKTAYNLAASKAGTEVATQGANGLMSSTDKIKLDGVATGAEVNVQSDWDETDDASDAYIKNKPTIPAAQVNSDWNASSGVAQILNKPTIPAAQVNSDWSAASGVAQILHKPTLGTAAAKDVPASGNASTAQVVLGSDTRLSDSRNAADVYAWAKAATKPSYTADEVGAAPAFPALQPGVEYATGEKMFGKTVYQQAFKWTSGIILGQTASFNLSIANLGTVIAYSGYVDLVTSVPAKLCLPYNFDDSFVSGIYRTLNGAAQDGGCFVYKTTGVQSVSEVGIVIKYTKT